MTITKLNEVIADELERVYSNCDVKPEVIDGVETWGPKHRILISIEPKLFDKIIDKLLFSVGKTEEQKAQTKLITDQIVYVDYTIIKQKKDLSK